jgi:hypothetical protein
VEPPKPVEENFFAPPPVQTADLGAPPAPAWDPEPPAPAPAPAPAPKQAPAAPANEEEQKLHNDARRFARLLVSEIKLYNEQKVMDGRKNHDLYDRLKEDIDRSRQMYDKRVSALVAARFDYFYDELVSTLAEGDAVKLGRDCPGPSVQVS